MADILSTDRWANNAALIADVARLGYFARLDRDHEPLVLDATYGEGKFWTRYRPERLVTLDRYKAADVRASFHRPPFRPGVFDVVVYDPDYKLNGTPALAGMDHRYGVDRPKRWQDRLADIVNGVEERPACPKCDGLGGLAITLTGWVGEATVYETCPACDGLGQGAPLGLAQLVAPGGYLMVKCQDQIVSGHMVWQTDLVTERAQRAGLTKVARFDLVGTPLPQRSQCHARNNSSQLLIFERLASGRTAKAPTARGFVPAKVGT